MILIINKDSKTAENARKSGKWKEIEPGIFIGNHKNLKEILENEDEKS